MNLPVKRVAAVHDLSCVGRCSLTVIMPILSCMGIQVCPLPTAVLSTHLGGFKDVSLVDFTDQMHSVSSHWQREGISFDCIYSGFLASEKQIEVVSAFIDNFSASKPLVIVDPVMGDGGKLYSIFTDTMQERMKILVGKADVITPNYTEACFLLGKSYQETIEDKEQLGKWALQLADFGPSQVVITGIPLPNSKIMNLGYDRKDNRTWEVIVDHVPVRYPGTGDAFASVLTGALLKQVDLMDAMKMAAEFVESCIKFTHEAGTPVREGVLLEPMLPRLCRSLN